MSTTLQINLQALIVALALPALALGMLDSIMRTELLAHLTHWFTASLLLLCAVVVAAITEQPKSDQRRYRSAILALLACSVVETTFSAPALSLLTALRAHGSMTVLSAGLVVAAICVLEAQRAGAITIAPAVTLYVGGTVACAMIGNRDYEQPTLELLRALATLSRMLGPVLVLRALLRVLCPADQPAAIRFLLIPHGSSRSS